MPSLKHLSTTPKPRDIAADMRSTLHFPPPYPPLTIHLSTILKDHHRHLLLARYEALITGSTPHALESAFSRLETPEMLLFATRLRAELRAELSSPPAPHNGLWFHRWVRDACACAGLDVESTLYGVLFHYSEETVREASIAQAVRAGCWREVGRWLARDAGLLATVLPEGRGGLRMLYAACILVAKGLYFEPGSEEREGGVWVPRADVVREVEGDGMGGELGLGAWERLERWRSETKRVFEEFERVESKRRDGFRLSMPRERDVKYFLAH